jgi:hypothetical protein
MVFAVFGAVYAVCLVILALALLGKPSAPPTRPRDGAARTGAPGGGDGSEPIATHH